jgi:hypothetical protein
MSVSGQRLDDTGKRQQVSGFTGRTQNSVKGTEDSVSKLLGANLMVSGQSVDDSGFSPEVSGCSQKDSG